MWVRSETDQKNRIHLYLQKIDNSYYAVNLVRSGTVRAL